MEAAAAAGQRVAGMNDTHQYTSTVPHRVVVTVNGTSRLSYATPVPAPPHRREVFTLLPKRFMTSSKRQVVRMSLSVIVGFVACWLPYFVVSLVRIFSDYRIRLSGLLSAAELLALAHSALNPLIYGLFSARTLRQSCGHRCRRRRSTVIRDASTMSRWDALPPCYCCCCCGGQAVADVSPDAVANAAPPPLMLSPDADHLRYRQQPAIELDDMANVGSTATRRRHRNASGDAPAPSADASTTDTSAGEVCCQKSASAEFQRAVTTAPRSSRRRAHLQLTDYGTVARITVSAAVNRDYRVSVSDPIVRSVDVPPSTSVYEPQRRVDDAETQ